MIGGDSPHTLATFCGWCGEDHEPDSPCEFDVARVIGQPVIFAPRYLVSRDERESAS